jgi:hypothetical protein
MPTDSALEKVFGYLSSRSRLRERVGKVLREAIDIVLNGPATGYWDVKQLDSDTKKFIGKRVEQEFIVEFSLPRGKKTDLCIEGIEVDVKFSLDPHGHMIPKEHVGELCLLLWADDSISRFSMGLVRAQDSILNKPNQDGKRGIKAAGRSQIRWLVAEAQGELPINFLLHLDAASRDRILRQTSAQARMTELFRTVQKRIIPRDVIVTLGNRRDDPLKRVRDTRQVLLQEGIGVLGHLSNSRLVAIQKGLPPPRLGEFLSTPVTPQEAALLKTEKGSLS